MTDDTEIVPVKAWKDADGRWHAAPIGWPPPYQQLELLDAELHIPLPEREPVRCRCGKIPAVVCGSKWNVSCPTNGMACWIGPIRPTAREAIEAWDEVMR